VGFAKGEVLGKQGKRTLRCWPSGRRDLSLRRPWARLLLEAPASAPLLSLDESAVWARRAREPRDGRAQRRVGRRIFDEAFFESVEEIRDNLACIKDRKERLEVIVKGRCECVSDLREWG
jgi:hypothetical protein